MQASKFVLMAENRDFFMLERSGHYVYISTVQDLYCTVLDHFYFHGILKIDSIVFFDSLKNVQIDTYIYNVG